MSLSKSPNRTRNPKLLDKESFHKRFRITKSSDVFVPEEKRKKTPYGGGGYGKS